MTDAYTYDLVCIGSGPAGQRAAVQAAKLGKRAAVLEDRRCWGGVCVDTGTIPSKTFREAVLSFRQGDRGARVFGATAVPVRPTAEQLLSRVREVVEAEHDVIEAQLRRNDVTLLTGRGSFKDPHTVAVETPDGTQFITTEFVLVATGARPTEPPGIAVDGERLITSDGVLALKALPKTMAVVGGGVIGIEYASMFAALGIAVTLVEKRERPLEFLDREIVEELVHQMRDANVTFRFGEAVASIGVSKGPPPRSVLELESGKRIVSDLVLHTVGRTGNTDKLSLENVGLTADERGRLKTDERMRTSVPNIFAAGDVIGFPALAATSSEQGRLAACHMFGAPATEMTRHFPYGIYAIPEISMVGATEQELTERKIPYECGVARYREIARGMILGDDSGFLKLIFHRTERTLLGTHVLGTQATELVHIGQAVEALGGGLDYFLNSVFNYPTLAECYKVAARDAANKLAR